MPNTGTPQYSFPGSLVSSPTLSQIKGILFDGGGTVLAAGLVGAVQIPFNGTVTGWNIFSTDGVSGSITVDVQTTAFGSGIYTNTPANSMIQNPVSGGTHVPSLSSQTTNSYSGTLGWTTANVTAGNYLVFVTSGVTTVDAVRIELTIVPR